MRGKETFRRTELRLAVVALATALAAGCASGGASMQLVCDGRINDDLLLTIDLVRVSEDEARQIRQAGDQWFYSDLRRQLRTRIQTITVESGCSEEVSVAGAQKGYKVLAIVADFKSESTDPAHGHMEFRNKDEWQGKRLQIAVHDSYLTVYGR